MTNRFYIISGGLLVHVSPHFALCAPAYGSVGSQIEGELTAQFAAHNHPAQVVHLRTKMARASGRVSNAERETFNSVGLEELETNTDLETLVSGLVSQPETKGIILASAVCDWEPQSMMGRTAFGKDQPRLQTSNGSFELSLSPARKVIPSIRKQRKDIFLVGFKATTGMTEQEQYITGLGLLKSASCNLVFSNDVHERRNMVITPEEAKYHVTSDRDTAIKGLCEMVALRSQLRFTRSTVIEGDAIPWDSSEIPTNLQKVVNHLISRGAYKPFMGKTVGHFATRGQSPGEIYTSRRKSNFNHLAMDGLLRIKAVGDDEVVAYGAKPSVGGQSQRIVFTQHPDVDCIVHAHVPLKGSPQGISVRPQRPFECGSHECGINTSEGLREVWPGIKAVMLDEHGPNICFSKDVNPEKVIEFIETFWDLDGKTGGPVEINA